MRLGTASFGISLAVAVVVACSERYPTLPEEDTTTPGVDQRDTAVIAGLIASNALASMNLYSLVVRGSSNALAGDVAFVSAAPGTFSGKDSVFVSNPARTVVISSAKLVDGGFDPISISAESGDVLQLTVVVANGNRPEPFFLKVPRRRPPAVVRTVPRNGRTDVALNVHIEVVFSEPIDKSTVTTSSLSLSESGKSVNGTIRVSEDGLSAEFIPQNELAAGATYELSVTGAIRDLGGDALTEDTPVTFVASEGPGHIAFTISGGTMYVMNADGTNWVQLGRGFAPAWMPDGSLLYVWGECDQCALVPWIRASDGNARRFLPEAVSDGWSFSYPSPTLDGSRVAFVRSSKRSSFYEFASNELVIVTVNDFSLARVPLPDGIVPLYRPSWSPDQSRIVFSCAEKVDVQLENLDLCFVNADGSAFSRFGRADEWEFQPAWNPITGNIAFTRGITIGTDSYMFVNAMGDEGGANLSEFGAGSEVAWSPDGRTLLFCRSPLIAVSDGVQRVVYSDPRMPFLYDLAWGRR